MDGWMDEHIGRYSDRQADRKIDKKKIMKKMYEQLKSHVHKNSIAFLKKFTLNLKKNLGAYEIT